MKKKEKKIMKNEAKKNKEKALSTSISTIDMIDRNGNMDLIDISL